MLNVVRNGHVRLGEKPQAIIACVFDRGHGAAVERIVVPARCHHRKAMTLDQIPQLFSGLISVLHVGSRTAATPIWSGAAAGEEEYVLQKSAAAHHCHWP